MQRLQGLIPVINATGILVHTNLGRAPLAPEALAAVERLAHGYSNLEYDLAAGERGSRYERVDDAVVRAHRRAGRLGRQQLRGGRAARARYVRQRARGDRRAQPARRDRRRLSHPRRARRAAARCCAKSATTNASTSRDFERALSPADGAAAARASIELPDRRISRTTFRRANSRHSARRAGVPVVEDLGSGALVDLAEYGLPHERTVGEALADGVGLVAFSGDKLLGGPQAGILVGSRASDRAAARQSAIARAARRQDDARRAGRDAAPASRRRNRASAFRSIACSRTTHRGTARTRARRMSPRCRARPSSTAMPTPAAARCRERASRRSRSRCAVKTRLRLPRRCAAKIRRSCTRIERDRAAVRPAHDRAGRRRHRHRYRDARRSRDLRGLTTMAIVDSTPPR